MYASLEQMLKYNKFSFTNEISHSPHSFSKIHDNAYKKKYRNRKPSELPHKRSSRFPEIVTWYKNVESEFGINNTIITSLCLFSFVLAKSCLSPLSVPQRHAADSLHTGLSFSGGTRLKQRARLKHFNGPPREIKLIKSYCRKTTYFLLERMFWITQPIVHYKLQKPKTFIHFIL